MTRYAIIGAGMMGHEHISNLALIDDIELVALADPEQSSLDQSKTHAGRYGYSPACFQDIDEMFAAVALDAVIISSPNYTHFEVMQRVIKQDAAVLLEKPMCTTVEDATLLHEMVQDHPHLVWVGMEYRYMPPVAEFIKRVQKGITGEVKMLSIREHRFPFLKKIGDWNRFSENTGGTLVEKCCHFFDLMRFTLQDEPVRIFASGGQDVNHLDERYDGRKPDILDNAYVMLDFAKGTRAVLDLCMFAEGSEEQEQIYALGDIGKLEVGIPSANLKWSPRDRSGAVTQMIDTPADALEAGYHHGSTFFQLTQFQEALKQGKSPEVSTLDGLRAVQMGAAAHQSIETGLPVDLASSDSSKEV